MAKMKRYIMDIEEKVYDLDLEKIITDSENTSEAKALVLKELKFTSSFDIGIVSDVIDQCWNEYWGDYVTCLLYTSPSPRDMRRSRMPSSA